MSNLFTQQPYYSKDHNQISYFGPRDDVQEQIILVNNLENMLQGPP